MCPREVRSCRILGLASAAMIADRSEMFPEASFPALEIHRHCVCKRIDLERGKHHASFEPLESRTQPPHSRLVVSSRKLNMLHPFRKIERAPRTQPEIRALSDPRLRSDLPIKIGALLRNVRRMRDRSLPAYLPVPRARQHRPSQCPVASNSPIKLRKSARSRTESNSLLFANRSLSLNPAAKAW